MVKKVFNLKCGLNVNQFNLFDSSKCNMMSKKNDSIKSATVEFFPFGILKKKIRNSPKNDIKTKF